MLNKDKETMKRFESERGLEGEKNALANELNFLREVRNVVPDPINIKLFRVLSWTLGGTPTCVGLSAEMPTRKNIDLHVESINVGLRELSSERTTKDGYDNRMTNKSTESHSNLSSILNLKIDMKQERWPVVEMKIPPRVVRP